MRSRKAGLGLAAAACAAMLGACDGGLLSTGSGEGAPVGIQLVHPAGVVVQVLSVRASGDRTLVNIRVLNGREREIKLSSGNEQSFILTEAGEKLPLIDSATNPGLAVPPGKSMDGALVFAGELPRSGEATLILNERGSRDNQYASNPRFEAALPLDEARGGGAVPETSSLANMTNLPASRLAPAQAAASTLSAGGNAASDLQAVAKLKSELGAVESERGTVVSLASDVTFDFDKASLRGEGRAALDRLAELIKSSPDGDISVEGHTDAKGDDAYNKRLSEQRAEAVKQYLVDQGVTAGRIKTIGLGELRPVAPNAKPDGTDDEAGRQRNRRVEVILPNDRDTAGSQQSAPPS